MPRWPAGAQERLQQSAIELFDEQGYDRTTVAQIAGRAGLTERTFYNHFVDKREVLFPGQADYVADLVASLRGDGAAGRRIDALVEALVPDPGWFDDRRESGATRRRIIDAHAELQERERTKMAAIATALAQVLQEQGVDPSDAALTATAAVAAYELATRSWLADPQGVGLRDHLLRAAERLRTVAKDW